MELRKLENLVSSKIQVRVRGYKTGLEFSRSTQVVAGGEDDRREGREGGKELEFYFV